MCSWAKGHYLHHTSINWEAGQEISQNENFPLTFVMDQRLWLLVQRKKKLFRFNRMIQFQSLLHYASQYMEKYMKGLTSSSKPSLSADLLLMASRWAWSAVTNFSLSKILQYAGRTTRAGRIKRLATALSSMIICKLLFNVNAMAAKRLQNVPWIIWFLYSVSLVREVRWVKTKRSSFHVLYFHFSDWIGKLVKRLVL